MPLGDDDPYVQLGREATDEYYQKLFAEEERRLALLRKAVGSKPRTIRELLVKAGIITEETANCFRSSLSQFDEYREAYRALKRWSEGKHPTVFRRGLKWHRAPSGYVSLDYRTPPQEVVNKLVKYLRCISETPKGESQC